MSAWAEVRQLAADLQRVQARSTSHHLSERNCVELISSLTGSGQLSVLHTQDGKEYVTPEQLEREARAELAGCRGRPYSLGSVGRLGLRVKLVPFPFRA